MSASVRITNVNGIPATVSITTAAGTPTVYSDDALSTPVVMPKVITADTTFYVANVGSYNVSVSVNGVEVAGPLTMTLNNSSAVAFSVDSDPRNVMLDKEISTLNLHSAGGLPLDYSLLEWTYDPATAVNTSVTVAGQVYFTKIRLRRPRTISNLGLFVATAGVTLTAGQNGAGLYSADGATQYAVTGDQSAVWTSTGFKSMAITPVTLDPGLYTIAFWANGTTPPAFGRASGSSIGNLNLTGAASRFGTAQTGVTAAPATLTSMTAAVNSWWASVS